MKKYASIDQSRKPIIHITFTGEQSTDENFQAYLNETKACYADQQKLVIIFDASHASLPSLRHQKMQANWLKENTTLMKDYCLGTAYVISNLAIRAILKMIFSFQKQPVPYKICQKQKEAEEWVKLQLNEKV